MHGRKNFIEKQKNFDSMYGFLTNLNNIVRKVVDHISEKKKMKLGTMKGLLNRSKLIMEDLK